MGDLDPRELRKLAIMFDRNNDGTISYLEFTNVVEGRSPPPEDPLTNQGHGADVLLNKVKRKMFQTFDSLRAAFLKYDCDRSGALDARELNAVLQSNGVMLEPDQLAQLLRSFDKNGDGQIDYNEFVQAMQ